MVSVRGVCAVCDTVDDFDTAEASIGERYFWHCKKCRRPTNHTVTSIR